MSEYHKMPTTGILQMPPLPDDWSRPLAILLPFVVLPVLFAVHAWYSGHVRRHGFPPPVLLRFAKWFH